jgi:hypothetical protein
MAVLSSPDRCHYRAFTLDGVTLLCKLTHGRPLKTVDVLWVSDLTHRHKGTLDDRHGCCVGSSGRMLLRAFLYFRSRALPFRFPIPPGSDPAPPIRILL